MVVLLLRVVHGRRGEARRTAGVERSTREEVTVPADAARAAGWRRRPRGPVLRGDLSLGPTAATRGRTSTGARPGSCARPARRRCRTGCWPWSRSRSSCRPPPAQWAKGHLLVGPSFPATGTSQGMANPAVHGYNPIALAGHPGTFLLLACLGSVVVWRLTGVWKRGAWATVWRGAVRQSWKSSPSVVLLASVAGVLVDTGMVRTVARGAAAATGHAYPAMAPLVGALGSFITGSTTSSNALFSALQREVAQLIGDRPADLLAGQLAGGNIGNSLAPVVILLGLSAVGSVRSAGQVLRMTLLPAAVLLLSVVATTMTLVAIH